MGNCKVRSHCLSITSILMQPVGQVQSIQYGSNNFIPKYFPFSVDSLLSEAHPPKHGCLLPSTCWVIGLQASTLLAEEGWLLERHHLLVVTCPLPQPNNLLAFTNTCLSSGFLTSSSVAHGPVFLSEPFIPTLTYAIQYKKCNNDKK